MSNIENNVSTSRIKKTIENINYDETKKFFSNRAAKYNENNPYSVTMYQDNKPDLVEKRNAEEVRKLKPYFNLNAKSRILDIACGIGRWSDAIDENVELYCGIDFSDELIDIAKKRNTSSKRHFYVGQSTDTEKIVNDNHFESFNVILLMGILIYLNESDLANTLAQVERVASDNSIICFREPVGLMDRLTLKNFYSQELNENYNAIYRTRDELMHYFDMYLINKGFSLQHEGFLFDQKSLNNRKETEQYFFVFKR